MRQTDGQDMLGHGGDGAYGCQIPGRGEDPNDVSWLMM
jgi:hypothetical protein